MDGAPKTDPIHPAAVLAFIAGFADASSFVGADGIFCAHVTGNFVVVAADVARHARADEWLKLATFPIFVSTVLVASFFHRRLAAASSRPASTRTLLAVVSLLFGAAAALACFVPTAVSGSGKSAVVAILVVAMGVQNSIHRLSPALGPMTTVMTGNVTQWFVERVIPGAPENAPKRRLLGQIIATFALGCFCGAVSVAHFGFVVLVVPMILALLVRMRLPA